jgi:hypothetical protein
MELTYWLIFSALQHVGDNNKLWLGFDVAAGTDSLTARI